MKYDPLIKYLERNSICSLDTALTLLNGYRSVQNAYGAIDRLVQQGRIERFVNGKPRTTWLRYRPTVRNITPRRERERYGIYDINEHWASLYAFLVRYGVQHFSSTGRNRCMAIMRDWIRQYEESMQFVDLLRELLEKEVVSRDEYIARERSLIDAGWITFDWQADERIDFFRELLNPDRKPDFMNISEDDWNLLGIHDDLSRIKGAKEGPPRPPDPDPEVYANWPHYVSELEDKFTIEELNAEWQRSRHNRPKKSP